MISHLNGTLEHVDSDHIVVDVGNVGYHVKVPASVVSRLPAIGQPVKLLTLQVVREDDISLFGFLTREERKLFSLLLSVSGVGPKAATSILSAIPAQQLVTAIAQGQPDIITSVSGIGQKTAQKIVIDLKNKVAKAYAIKPSDMVQGLGGDSPMLSDAMSALITLGYSPKEAREAIRNSGLDLDQENNLEVVIKKMKRFSVGRLPVVDKDNNLCGIISRHDLLKITLKLLNSLSAITWKQMDKESKLRL